MTASKYVSRHLPQIPKKGKKEIPAYRLRLETYLKNELTKLKKLHVGSPDDAHTFLLLDRKIADKPVRAFFAGEIFAFIRRSAQQEGLLLHTEDSHLFRQVIPFVTEVVISIQYFHNQILDSKAGVTCRNKKQIDQNLLSANLLKEYLYEYIEQETAPEHAGIITRYVRRIFKYVDVGQQTEKKWNTYESFEQGSYKNRQFHPEIEAFANPERVAPLLETLRRFYPERGDYADAYLQRIALTSAALFVLNAEMILELSGYTGNARQPILEFAWFYGMMQQVINDNADVVPSRFNHETTEKTASDAFSDARNHNVTLPLFLHLENMRHVPENYEPDLVKSILQRPFHVTLTNREEERMFLELRTSGALYLSIDIGKYFAAMAQNCLTDAALSDCQSLLSLCEVADWNRYIYDCYNKKDPHNKRLRKRYKDSPLYAAMSALTGHAKSAAVQHQMVNP
ncbi:MAG: hypothetical protein HUU01_00070 [Saprospiraceae bacterium]|nr:hypothetical protein [Saprospiraceae bacterium]